MTPKDIMDSITTIRGFGPNKVWVTFESKLLSREEFEQFVKMAETSSDLLAKLREAYNELSYIDSDGYVWSDDQKQWLKDIEAAIAKATKKMTLQEQMKLAEDHASGEADKVQKMKNLLTTDKELLAMVATAVRVFVYNEATLQTTKEQIEREVKTTMLSITPKIARRAISIKIRDAPMPTLTIIDAIEKAKAEIKSNVPWWKGDQE